MSIVTRTKQNVVKAKDAVVNHVLDHRHVYITGVTCLAAGVLIGNRQQIQQISIRVFSPGDDIMLARMDRRGHPGYVVKDANGKKYASKRQAAEELGVSLWDIDKHVEVLGEATL